MKIIAQVGFGPGEKITRGLQEGILDGAIFSPRYTKPGKITEKLDPLLGSADFLTLDPEYYATGHISHPTPNLGSLEEWAYFSHPRRARLISGDAMRPILEATLSTQAELGLPQLIAPNIYVRDADSIHAAIAFNFVAQTKAAAQAVAPGIPVYATLALHRDALLGGNDFRDVLDSLTAAENPPDGYYIVVGSNELQGTGRYVRSDLSHPEVIAAWMYMNYVLTINGARVINGYSFLLSPLMGICGAEGTASGWSSGLRKFCIDRYIRSGPGGQAPNVRYVSNALMAHVEQTDLDAYRAIDPEVLNGLTYDTPYVEGEPTRTEEALQAWQALRSASNAVDAENIETALSNYLRRIERAKIKWQNLKAAGFSNEIEPNIERLDAMRGGIEIFREWAEIS